MKAITMKSAIVVVLLGLASSVILSSAFAKDKVKVEQVALPAAGKSTIIKGKIRGDETVDYVFEAEAKRAMQADFKPSNSSCYVNFMQEGKDEALFNGSLSGDRFKATAAETGTYRARIYLMRNAARRNASCSYTLTLR